MTSSKKLHKAVKVTGKMKRVCGYWGTEPSLGLHVLVMIEFGLTTNKIRGHGYQGTKQFSGEISPPSKQKDGSSFFFCSGIKYSATGIMRGKGLFEVQFIMPYLVLLMAEYFIA